MTVALVAYASAVLLVTVWAGLHLLPARPRGWPELPATYAALLRRRGRRRAVAAAVAELRAAGLVTVDERGRPRRTDATAHGDVSAFGDLSGPARAVHQALTTPRAPAALAVRAPVRAALRDATGELVRYRAVPEPRRWRLSRLALLGVVVVTLLGLTRAGALPAALLPLALGLLAGSVAAWFLPRRTIAGARLLRRHQAATGP